MPDTARRCVSRQVSEHKLGSMPVALRALPGVGQCMALGERLELLSTAGGAARFRQQPLNVPPALHATPLRLADGHDAESKCAHMTEGTCNRVMSPSRADIVSLNRTEVEVWYRLLDSVFGMERRSPAHAVITVG